MLQIGDSTNSWANYTSSAIPTINDGDWHHVAVTVDRNNSSGGRMYVDGELVYTFNPTGRQGNTNNSVALEIGRTTGGGNYLDGTLDEVMLFNRSLSQATVRDLYQASANGVCPISAPSASMGCFGNYSSSGQVTCITNVSGGVPPYTYNWSYSGTADSWSSGGAWGYAYYFFGGCNSSDVNFFFVTVTDGIGQTANASMGPLTCF